MFTTDSDSAVDAVNIAPQSARRRDCEALVCDEAVVHQYYYWVHGPVKSEQFRRRRWCS